jgi:ABC-type cobalamin/Fe3+-siderophores transport system ATPase subunit
MDSIIQVADLAVRFRKHPVLEGITFSIYPGEFVAILGKNGCGKSTLLKTLMGFIKPSRGEIQLFGHVVKGQSFLKAGPKIGYLPQNLHIDFRMPFSVRDIVAMGRLNQRKTTPENSALINEVMENVGILPLADRPVGHLSGGEKQKVQIARILYQNPQLLLLDEPASHLDISAQFELLELLKNIHQEKKITTLLVMHDIQNLPDSCQRAIIIHDLTTYFDGPLARLYAKEVLQPIFNSYADKLLCRN